jgi:hypothetical protein
LQSSPAPTRRWKTSFSPGTELCAVPNTISLPHFLTSHGSGANSRRRYGLRKRPLGSHSCRSCAKSFHRGYTRCSCSAVWWNTFAQCGRPCTLFTMASTPLAASPTHNRPVNYCAHTLSAARTQQRASYAMPHPPAPRELATTDNKQQRRQHGESGTNISRRSGRAQSTGNDPDSGHCTAALTSAAGRARRQRARSDLR